MCVGGEGGMCGNSYTDICPGSEAVSLVISINGCVRSWSVDFHMKCVRRHLLVAQLT